MSQQTDIDRAYDSGVESDNSNDSGYGSRSQLRITNQGFVDGRQTPERRELGRRLVQDRPRDSLGRFVSTNGASKSNGRNRSKSRAQRGNNRRASTQTGYARRRSRSNYKSNNARGRSNYGNRSGKNRSSNNQGNNSSNSQGNSSPTFAALGQFTGRSRFYLDCEINGQNQRLECELCVRPQENQN
ncbi:hypothetical protein M3Y98_00016000 [Aphelenchoides besseyi]|nr:hypothetical protein M3Y98_00016000 [Aphelenchoides besseyi]KAI6199202.1 hypothetical protein M3Y96_00601400 [Aphelenchoides besseyi]